MEHIDAIVVGAGVIGLACARALAAQGHETLLLERHAAFGSETSARNSEVIHAGLYYPTGSLKARFCVAGRHRLYDFCHSHGVAHQRCGKLIVATHADQEGKLEALAAQARANGVDDVVPLTATAARTLEPALACVAALHAPATGIIDSHGLMLALLGDAERGGATLAVNTPFIRAEVHPAGGFIVTAGHGADAMTLRTARLINAAGLAACQVAGAIDGLAPKWVPTPHYAKGSYFSISGRAPFTRLIYPLPEPGGLGVHLTLDLGGQARFGPDVEWIDDSFTHTADGTPDYRVDPQRAATFYAEVRRYWPALADGALTPAYAGVRPKIVTAGAAAADFIVQGPDQHGLPGLINFFGIESPGLTACLALADAACTALK